MEIIQLVSIPDNELNKVKELIIWAIKELGVPCDDIIIYITDNHNRVREALGLKEVTHEEWPIKYIDAEGRSIISVLPSELLRLKEDARIIALREVALVKVLNDPELVSMWIIPQGINDNVMYRVSLAMLRRTVDFVIAKSQLLIQYMINAFNRDELRNVLMTCEQTIDCAIMALALDVPLSIELAGNMGLGKSLWNDTVKGLDNDFVRRYGDFRDFTRNNFNVENAYNYLLMMFKKNHNLGR